MEMRMHAQAECCQRAADVVLVEYGLDECGAVGVFVAWTASTEFRETRAFNVYAVRSGRHHARQFHNKSADGLVGIDLEFVARTRRAAGIPGIRVVERQQRM